MLIMLIYQPPFFLVRSIDITLQSWAKKAHLYLNDILCSVIRSVIPLLNLIVIYLHYFSVSTVGGGSDFLFFLQTIGVPCVDLLYLYDSVSTDI